MKVDELDYALPEELIAQTPAARREDARLLVVNGDARTHSRIGDLVKALPEHALLVFNDTRVMAARLFGRKASGGRVELLLVEQLGESDDGEERWLAMGRASKPIRPGAPLTFRDAQDEARLIAVMESRDGPLMTVTLRASRGSVEETVEQLGEVPLPPYINREAATFDKERYQTVYARHRGAVAAPTAGLHFSDALLDELSAAGHERAFVTLHVGPGTFRPVTADSLEDHPMHEEAFSVPEATVAAIAKAKEEGRAIVAVGTTVVRTLESASDDDGALVAGTGRTELFIRPPYRFQVVDLLLTNFHLPRSTLLALVMTLGGVEEVREAYRDAVREQYRFFSYGDAMLVFPKSAS